MTGFRKELLELFYKNSGDWVDINPLLEKYCGTETSFNSGDDTFSSQQRLPQGTLRSCQLSVAKANKQP